MRRVLSLLLHPRRLLTLVGLFVAGVTYVWIAAVRSVPSVRRRKAAFREAWRSRKRDGD